MLRSSKKNAETETSVEVKDPKMVTVMERGSVSTVDTQY